MILIIIQVLNLLSLMYIKYNNNYFVNTKLIYENHVLLDKILFLLFIFLLLKLILYYLKSSENAIYLKKHLNYLNIILNVISFCFFTGLSFLFINLFSLEYFENLTGVIEFKSKLFDKVYIMKKYMLSEKEDYAICYWKSKLKDLETLNLDKKDYEIFVLTKLNWIKILNFEILFDIKKYLDELYLTKLNVYKDLLEAETLNIKSKSNFLMDILFNKWILSILGICLISSITYYIFSNFSLYDSKQINPSKIQAQEKIFDSQNKINNETFENLIKFSKDGDSLKNELSETNSVLLDNVKGNINIGDNLLKSMKEIVFLKNKVTEQKTTLNLLETTVKKINMDKIQILEDLFDKNILIELIELKNLRGEFECTDKQSLIRTLCKQIIKSKGNLVLKFPGIGRRLGSKTEEE